MTSDTNTPNLSDTDISELKATPETIRVPVEQGGQRLDRVVADLFPAYSRERLKAWIQSGRLSVDGRQLKPSAKLLGGELVSLVPAMEEQGEWLPENIPLNLVYQDEHIVVIDKPAGLVVHPGAGNGSGTLLNALLHHFPELKHLPRAGIVHRLDKDTSGLMVVAHSLEAQHHLVKQLQARTMGRVYEALVQGRLERAGEVALGVGRHAKVRTKMACENHGAEQVKPALTYYEPLSVFEHFTRLRLTLSTGRTHQIRVHMAHLNHPLVGDPVYGRGVSSKLTKNNQAMQQVDAFPRQALHAVQLTLAHPITGRELTWQSPYPEDMEALLRTMVEHQL